MFLTSDRADAVLFFHMMWVVSLLCPPETFDAKVMLTVDKFYIGLGLINPRLFGGLRAVGEFDGFEIHPNQTLL
ncbi:hypothetical protein JXM67_14695 [candidate division WOR-3 bacterium]|nr:hypothetical protein [candidate division WOR-3 bacterium]